MNRIILLVFILAISLKVAGQYTPGTAPVQYEKGYIYLKDGSVLKGKYLYSSSLDKVRVISGKNSWIFNSGDVEKISVKRPLLSFEENTGFDASPGTTVPVPVWFSLMEIGVLAGNDDNNRPAPLVFGASLNRRIWKNLSAGAGIGAEFLNETYMPVTANLMYRLRQSRFTPFAMLQSGYQIPIEESRTVYYRVVPDYIYSSVIWPGPWPSYNSEMKAKG